MKKCPKCKEEIAGDANKCKHCGADLRNWFVKHKILTGIIALILILVIAGASGGNNAPSSTDTNKASSTENQKKEEPKKTNYAVGEVIKLDNHEIIVNSVNKNYKSGNEYVQPQNTENNFVTVNVTITNNGKNDLPANIYGFKLEDETGVQRDTTFIAGINNQLEWVTLSPNGKISGNIAFEAKANSKILKLHYSGGFLGGGEIIVNL